MNENKFDVKPHVPSKRLNILPENPDAAETEKAVGLGRFPKWLHRKLPKGRSLWETQKILSTKRLPTVCEEAKCPNLLECWSKKTATFLAMGKSCTRNCGFCDIDFAKTPEKLMEDEPERLAASVKELRLEHVVITMVARDDLPDGGASHLARIIQKVRKENPKATIEVLTSDFEGNEEALKTVLREKPEIFNHNIETVRALTPRVRHKATYDRTLQMLKLAKKEAPQTYIKSGFMVGLGEKENEVKETLQDLKEAGCKIVTIGQYLQPNRKKLLVKAFIHPDLFESYAAYGRSIGIPNIYAGPFIRSSYNAKAVFENIQN